MKARILVLLISLLHTACATTDAPATAVSAANAITSALAAQRRAAVVGYEWRDTGALIDEARKAVEAKEYAKAIELAAKAKRQGIAALRQYRSQKNAAKRY